MIKSWWYIFWKQSLRKLGTYYSLNTLLVSGLVDKRKNHKTVSLEIRKYYCSLSQYFFGCSKSKADNGNCAVIGAVFSPMRKCFESCIFWGEWKFQGTWMIKRLAQCLRWKSHPLFMKKLVGVRMGVVVGFKAFKIVQ